MVFKFVLLVCLIAVTLANPTKSTVEDDWKQFKIDFNRNYSGEEEEKRFKIFKENWEKVQAHNALHHDGKSSYTLRLNDFSDKTEEELSHSRGKLVITETIEQKWKQFKIDYERNFTPEEDARRFEIFKTNVADIEAHNKNYDAGKVSWKEGINQFTDRTEEEFKSESLGLKV